VIDALIEIGPEAYACAYFFGLAAVAAAEARKPRRAASVAQGRRWGRNAGIALLDLALVRWIFPAAGIAAAILVAHQSWGLLHAFGLNDGLALLLGLVLLDLGRWLQHYLLHRSRWLWHMHAVHHSDLDYDFSTALRFHPFETIYSALFNVAVIALVGAPVAAVVVYEIVSVLFASFAHGNLGLPLGLDRQLRRVIVTPDLHRVHHSLEATEQATNFGAVTPVWDRLFGTYTDQPERGHEAMEIGLRGQRDGFSQSMLGMLASPFRLRIVQLPPAQAPAGALERG
jgi:sterol desaturase/sphingolipid hydroxylase (fatty acid hydroxylase superfamily)